MAALISQAEQEYIQQGVEADIRNDGRQRLDYRPIELELGVVAQASGSARLKLGKTDVIVGVKVRNACLSTGGRHCADKKGAGGLPWRRVRQWVLGEAHDHCRPLWHSQTAF